MNKRKFNSKKSYQTRPNKNNSYYNDVDSIKFIDKKPKKVIKKNEYSLICKFINIIIIFIILLFLIKIFFKFGKINKSGVKKECTDKKLYWNNEISLNIFHIKKEISNYNKYNISFDNKNDFYKRENPKVSIIITVYNQENYLKIIYTYIQRQTLKDIEIVFVDDASTDNSSKIIHELMEKDKRIVYVKNNVNKRAFHSRNKGIIISKGEYIITIDPDDLLINNILIKAYETAKKYDLDILQFYAVTGSYNKNGLWRTAKYRSGILCGEDVKDVFYHGITRNLWDKLVKRKVYIASIEFMNKEFHNEIYVLHNDDTAFFGLIKSAKTYGFLEQIGYFYNLNNPKSTFHFYFEEKYMNNIFHSLFVTMKYYYIQSDNTSIEKNFGCYNFFYFKIFKSYLKKIKHLTSGFEYIIDVLDLYLKCEFFDKKKKFDLSLFKNMIQERRNEIQNNNKKNNIETILNLDHKKIVNNTNNSYIY